jgi:hypothetical protein
MPKTSLLFAIVLLLGCSDMQAQIHRDLFSNYELYRERSIETRRFKHADLTRLIEQLEPPLSYQVAGKSMEGRDIYLVKAGNGPVKVLLWSQMHGDESTATMALLDIFNFLGRQDGLSSLRGRLLQSLTIYFIPMLNPDGAERFQRRNALNIDINRDAVRLATPEAQLLKKVRDDLQPEWGFNLHDQSRYTAAGRTDQTATVSFLAPAYNYEKEVNMVRGNAMRLIGLMNKALQTYIPGKVARYNDDFEPRAFGDNIQKWGTSTILIESGGLEDDPEKQYIRKINYVAILSALEAISTKAYQQTPIEEYEKIPFNQSGQLHDLIIREIQIPYNDSWYTVDLGIRRQEVDFNNNRNFYYRSSIQDIGDLSVFESYEELNAANNYRAYYGRKYPNVVANLDELKTLDVVGLLRNGYTQVEVQTLPEPAEIDQLPLKITAPGETVDDDITIGRNPSLLFVGRDGRARYVLVNGFVFDLDQDQDRIATLIKFL